MKTTRMNWIKWDVGTLEESFISVDGKRNVTVNNGASLWGSCLTQDGLAGYTHFGRVPLEWIEPVPGMHILDRNCDWNERVVRGITHKLAFVVDDSFRDAQKSRAHVETQVRWKEKTKYLVNQGVFPSECFLCLFALLLSD